MLLEVSRNSVAFFIFHHDKENKYTNFSCFMSACFSLRKKVFKRNLLWGIVNGNTERLWTVCLQYVLKLSFKIKIKKSLIKT